MALIAECGDRRHVQQPRILRSVRRMAGRAALCPHRSVFKRKWPAHIGVALGADRVLVFGGSLVVGQERPVHIVAVGALDQTFIHLVVNGHVELSLLVCVALVAERGLRGLEQLLFLATVDVVATGAADVGLGMRRTVEVGVRARVALQAGGVNLFLRVLGGVEDLGDVAAAFNVSAARTMATFAVHAGLAVLRRKLGVRIALELFGHLFVAGSAYIAADIGIGSCILGLRDGRFGG